MEIEIFVLTAIHDMRRLGSPSASLGSCKPGLVISGTWVPCACRT